MRPRPTRWTGFQRNLQCNRTRDSSVNSLFGGSSYICPLLVVANLTAITLKSNCLMQCDLGFDFARRLPFWPRSRQRLKLRPWTFACGQLARGKPKAGAPIDEYRPTTLDFIAPLLNSGRMKGFAREWRMVG